MNIEMNWIIITIIVVIASAVLILVPLAWRIKHRKQKTKVYTNPQAEGKQKSSTLLKVFLVKEKTGERILLTKNETLIGRSDENDIILEEDSYVSLQHAKIMFENEIATIYDLNSANGIIVNNKLIDSYSSLSNESSIQIGKSRFRFVLTNDNST